MNTPEQRIQIIEQSMRCFIYSLWGLVPILGIVLAIKALLIHRRVRSVAGTEWNPAGNYLKWGKRLAWSLILFKIVALLIFIAGWMISSWITNGSAAYES